MQEKKDKIKDLVNKGLSQFEAEPPLDMWARIERQSRRRKKLFLIYGFSIAASVLILVAIGISILIPGNKPGQNSNQLQAEAKRTNANVSSEQSSGTVPIVKEITSLPESSGDHIAATKASIKTTEVKKADRKAETVVISIEPEKETEIISLIAENATENAIPAENKETTEPIGNPEIAVVQSFTNPVNEDSLSRILHQQAAQPPVTEAQENRGWGLALGYGSNPSFELTKEDYAMNSGNTSFSYDEMSSGVANETSYFDEVENTTHNAPLALGVLISRQLSKKWNLETGLVYTKLGYRIKTSEINQTFHEYRSEIYYLGIPLGVRFGIIERKRFGIYVSQSLIIEKGISASTFNDTYNQGLLTGSENNSVSIRGMQLSSLTGIGAEINIAPRLSFYGQSGLQLFFLNASQPYNIRSARMAWPSFQLGLRIKINQRLSKF